MKKSENCLRSGLEDILERNHQRSEGSCPWCQYEDYPVDDHGKKIPIGGNIDVVEEWHLDHATDCAVTMIEDLLNGKYKFMNPVNEEV